ncbi:neuropeptide F receptor-like [Oppia nitens]|uniref:neuropeptide F receptor-like n=1 Tax=Oppia nitens TaxID=1686743 RepID=UPI0023DCAFFE|nr:neuropeptide F receptor-like [Oppia nitens]
MCETLPTMSNIVINTTYTGNETADELQDLMARLESYINNRALDNISLISLIIAYAILIFIGTLGNGLVCIVVARKPKMRTSRNLFIINLAISDLLLCFFTIPFSLVEISVKFWPFGVTMCKLVVSLEATSIFVSTISITAIALDRYQVILHSGGDHRMFGSIVKLVAIWIMAIMLALPLFLYRTVESHELSKLNLPWLKSVNYCVERWPIAHGRGYYSVFSMVFQYVLPILIVSIVYTRLCMKLRTRALRRTSTTQLPKLKSRLKKRTRKTNSLLISIALIFCISWLPLNLINIVADFCFPFKSDTTFRIVFAICHMAGMSSACSNPLLYGWLNQNFRNEFKELYSVFHSFVGKCFGTKSAINNNNNTILKSGGVVDRRPSHIYCGPTHLFDDDLDHNEMRVNGLTRETMVLATSANNIPLTVSCEYN